MSLAVLKSGVTDSHESQSHRVPAKSCHSRISAHFQLPPHGAAPMDRVLTMQVPRPISITAATLVLLTTATYLQPSVYPVLLNSSELFSLYQFSLPSPCLFTVSIQTKQSPATSCQAPYLSLIPTISTSTTQQIVISLHPGPDVCSSLSHPTQGKISTQTIRVAAKVARRNAA